MEDCTFKILSLWRNERVVNQKKTLCNALESVGRNDIVLKVRGHTKVSLIIIIYFIFIPERNIQVLFILQYLQRDVIFFDKYVNYIYPKYFTINYQSAAKIIHLCNHHLYMICFFAKGCMACLSLSMHTLSIEGKLKHFRLIFRFI